MTNQDKMKLLALAKNAAQVAASEIISSEPKVKESIGKDIKIDADFNSHQIIKNHLSKTDIPVFSEEDSLHNFKESTKWVVDPLDGSMNFSRGIPISCISISLVEDSEPILGIIFDFNREEMFEGIVGSTALLNGKQISVSNVKNKSDAIIASGFPAYTDFSNDALEKYIASIQDYKKVRLLGSSAISLAYVACGRIDAYYEKDIKIWDVSAGLAIIKAAGGNFKISDIDELGRCEVHASNSRLLTNII